MQELNEENLNEIMKSTDLVALDFFGDWCGPCKKMLPIYDNIDSKIEDITFYKVNVDYNKTLIAKYNVRSIPTVVIIKKGKEVGRITGSMSEEEAENKVKTFI